LIYSGWPIKHNLTSPNHESKHKKIDLKIESILYLIINYHSINMDPLIVIDSDSDVDESKAVTKDKGKGKRIDPVEYQSRNKHHDEEPDQGQVDTLPWIEKYRPATFDRIVSHTEIINTLKIFIKNRCIPHVLFYGPPGTGKTTMINICAKELYGKYYPYMVMELNASDDRGIETVRNKIKQFVMSSNVFFGKTVKDRENIFKLVILDEIDAMTSDAQAILRKIVEKYTYNTRFCLICNYIQNINPALQSRCSKFRFTPIPSKFIKEKIIEIAGKENVNITPLGIQTIIKRSSGDMRKVLNILQSVSMSYQKVNEKNINTCLGYPMANQIEIIIRCLIMVPFGETYTTINDIKNDSGISLEDIITEIHDVLVEYVINDNAVFECVKVLSIDTITRILDKLRMIEINNSKNTIESIQVGGLIGIFKMYVD